jgi:hypothetical protein
MRLSHAGSALRPVCSTIPASATRLLWITVSVYCSCPLTETGGVGSFPPQHCLIASLADPYQKESADSFARRLVRPSIARSLLFRLQCAMARTLPCLARSSLTLHATHCRRGVRRADRRSLNAMMAQVVNTPCTRCNGAHGAVHGAVGSCPLRGARAAGKGVCWGWSPTALQVLQDNYQNRNTAFKYYFITHPFPLTTKASSPGRPAPDPGCPRARRAPSPPSGAAARTRPASAAARSGAPCRPRRAA